MPDDSLPPDHHLTPEKTDPNAPSSAFVKRQLEAEQVQQLYRGFPLSFVASIVIALTLSASHWHVVALPNIIGWNLILGGVLLLRLILWLCWHNLHQLYSPLFWLNCFRVGAWLTGSAWGSAALLLFAPEASIYQALLAFTLAGVATGSITSLTVDKYSSIGFVILAISPLSVTILLQSGPTAIAMSSMTVIFIFFVIAGTTRTRNIMIDQLNKQFDLLRLSEALERKQKLEHIINNAQSIFINENNIHAALDDLLQNTLSLCHSKLGFIGQIEQDDNNQPFMRALVFASSKPNDLQLKLFREKHLPPKGEYHNLENLFGSIMQTGKPVISNNIARDMRAATLPTGHPHIEKFIGIPIFNGKDKVAILGLANAAENYSNAIIDDLEPILKTISQFVQTLNHQQQHEQDRAALEASNQQHQTVLNDIADGVIIINKHGIIESFNHAAETIFGYRAPQVIGNNISMLMPEPDRSMHNDHLRQHLHSGKKNIIGIGRETQGLRRNGQEFPMDLMVSRVFQQGEPVFIGIVRDITEKKRLEDLRSQFINSASREILRPLNLISEAITLLNRRASEELPEHFSSLINIAQTNSVELQKIMRDLIEMQDITQQEISFDPISQPVIPLVKRVITQQAIFGEIYQCKMQLKAHTGSPMIHTNSQRFEQALGQLLHFLLKEAGRDGAVQIGITDKEGQLTIEMNCNSHQLQGEKLFDLQNQFGQNTARTNTQFAGAELGLAIAKGIIEKIQGTIFFEVTPQKLGFKLCFPQALSKA